MLEESVRRVDAFRAAHPEHPIVDLQYADLVQQPLETMATLYSSLGLELDRPTEAAIAAYVESHPKGKFGVHGYNLAEFGLVGEELAERFAGYTARYQVPPERPAG